ncbi:MAG: PilZ domain-containing protein [Planctomycetaceae bacterium]|nr:PilZ domain-containing protein [Planctomycetaceae bacterium]
MSAMKCLTGSAIGQTLAGAVERHIPLTVTVHNGRSWQNLHSRCVGLDSGYLLVEIPRSDSGPCPALQSAQSVGVNFKYKHHKHIFMTTIAGAGSCPDESGSDVPVLRLTVPVAVQCLQRRAYSRVSVPEGRIVRVSFWAGGVESEPTSGSGDTPVWSGRADNLSAGGVQVACGKEVSGYFESGEPVGMHLLFGLGAAGVGIEAQFRHEEPLGQGVLLGFQFVGLEQTEQGCAALREITRWVTQFERESAR